MKNEPFLFEAYEEPFEPFWTFGEGDDWLGEVNRRSADYTRWLQRALNHILRLRLAVDGIVGPQTRSAIRRFQQNHGLHVDGIAGPATEAALLAAGASPPPGRSQPSPTPSAFLATSVDRSTGLARLSQLSSRATAPSIGNAIRILKLVGQYHRIPWKIGFITLEHEGGIRLFTHHDGVMQTTRPARNTVIPLIPRDLKLSLLGLSLTDRTPDASLDRSLLAEFPHRLAVQITAGFQELKRGLDKFSGYLALAWQAYNAGQGWAYYTVSGGKSKHRPPGISSQEWENRCRFGASLLHQLPGQLHIRTGFWQCDKNIPAWFQSFPIFDRGTGLQLIAYKYLRSFKACIRQHRPTVPCNAARHRQRDPGSGPLVCKPTRAGVLDKLYDPRKLGYAYYKAAQNELLPIPEDGAPLRVINGQLLKMPLASTVRAPLAPAHQQEMY